ncbi:MAG: DNA primase family protein, partial [bacterium]
MIDDLWEKTFESPQSEENEDTELRFARQFAQHITDCARYDYTLGAWYIWNGTVWQEDSGGREIIQLYDDFLKSLYMVASQLSPPKARLRRLDSIRSLETRSKQDNLFALAQRLCAYDHRLWDSHIRCLMLGNGVLDLNDLTLKPNDRGYDGTRSLGINFDGSKDCPSWKRFLGRIFNNDSPMIGFVQRLVGYTLLGTNPEQIIPFAHGCGRNGKSVFFEALRVLFGELFAKTSADVLMLRRGDSSTHELALLEGKRIVVASELSGNRRFNESLLKDISGGDTIFARRLYRDGYEFKPTFVLWLFGNEKPRIEGTNDGIWRRILLIPFEAVISKQEEMPMNTLLESFRVEQEGMLAWAVEGLRELKVQGLNPPPKVLAATKDYRSEEDVFRQFLDECVDDTP